MRKGTAYSNPSTAALISFFVNVAILAVRLGLFSGKARSINITRECLPYYGGVAVFALIGQCARSQRRPNLRGGAAINTTPLFVIGFTAIFLHGEEKINRFVVIGVVLLVAGIAAIPAR